MIGRRASQRLWRVPQCQEARLRLTSRKRARERTISPQPAWGGARAAAAADCVVAVGAIRVVVPAASLNVLRTLAFTEAVAFASAETRRDTLVASLLRPCSRRRSSRAHPAKPPPRPRGLIQCFPSFVGRSGVLTRRKSIPRFLRSIASRFCSAVPNLFDDARCAKY
jgi:hypothetical protein